MPVVRGLQVPVVQHQLRDDQAAKRLRVDERILVPRPLAGRSPLRQVGAESRGRLHAGVDAGQRELPHEVAGGLWKAHRPQDARCGHFGLRFDAELHAPHAARRVLHVVAGIGAGRLERDESNEPFSGGASAAPPGPFSRSRSSRSAGSCHSSAMSAEPRLWLRVGRVCARDDRNERQRPPGKE